MQEEQKELRIKIIEINKSQKIFVKEKNLTPEYWELEREKIKLKEELKKIKKKFPTKKQLENKEYKKLIRLADKYFAEFIKLRDTDKQWIGTCCTCNKRVKYLWRDLLGKIRKSWEVHCCHRIPRWYYSHRWNEENCYMWCNHCNTFDQENHHNTLTLIQVEKYWQERVSNNLKNKNRVKPSLEELKNIVEYYRKESWELRKQKVL